MWHERTKPASLHQTQAGSILGANQDMLDVFIDSEFPVTTTMNDGIVDVRFSIQPDEGYRVARTQRQISSRGA